MPILRLETPEDSSAVEALYARNFGPGRFARTAERLREGAAKLTDACFIACVDDCVVGAARGWAASVDGAPCAVFIGPVAVDAAWRGSALGRRLTDRVSTAAAKAGWPWAVLIGDEAYFAPVGFEVVESGLVAPGAVPPGRLLAKPLSASGRLQGRLSASPVSDPRGATRP